MPRYTLELEEDGFIEPRSIEFKSKMATKRSAYFRITNIFRKQKFIETKT